MSEREMAQNPRELPSSVEIRRLSYPDLPQVIGIERRVFPTPWSLAMFVLELSKQTGICLAAGAATVGRRQTDARRLGQLEHEHRKRPRRREHAPLDLDHLRQIRIAQPPNLKRRLDATLRAHRLTRAPAAAPSSASSASGRRR